MSSYSESASLSCVYSVRHVFVCIATRSCRRNNYTPSQRQRRRRRRRRRHGTTCQRIITSSLQQSHDWHVWCSLRWERLAHDVTAVSLCSSWCHSAAGWPVRYWNIYRAWLKTLLRRKLQFITNGLIWESLWESLFANYSGSSSKIKITKNKFN